VIALEFSSTKSWKRGKCSRSAKHVQCERERLFQDVRHVLHHPKGLMDGYMVLENIPEVGPVVGSGSITEYQLEAGPVPVGELQCDLVVQLWVVLSAV